MVLKMLHNHHQCCCYFFDTAGIERVQCFTDSILRVFGFFPLQDNFLPFLDMFQKESVKVDACKLIMEAFVK